MMLKKEFNRLYALVVFIVIIACGNYIIATKVTIHNDDSKVFLKIWMSINESSPVTVWYSEDVDFSDAKCAVQTYHNITDAAVRGFPIPTETKYIRIEFAHPGISAVIYRMCIGIGNDEYEFGQVLFEDAIQLKNLTISDSTRSKNGIVINCYDQNPAIEFSLSDAGYDFQLLYENSSRGRIILYKIVIGLVFEIIVAVFFVMILRISCEIKYIKRYWKADNEDCVEDIKHKKTGFQFWIVIVVFLICICGAFFVNPLYCPDEEGRQLITKYIYDNCNLPTGNEIETIITGWGFSYALRPYVSSIIGAIVMRICSVFTSSQNALLCASRLCSVFSITGLCYYCLKIGNCIFDNIYSSELFAVVVSFVPQVLFLGMYLNNDSLSLLACTMSFYYFLQGNQENWSFNNCVGLSVGLSLCLLSYYSIYPWIIICGILFIISCVSNDGTCLNKYSAKKIIFVFVMVVIMAGWFFVRNAALHNGDLLGIATESEQRKCFIEKGDTLYNYLSGNRDGESIFEFLYNNDYRWIRRSFRSTLGCFGYMSIEMPKWWYRFYYTVCVVAMLLCILKFIILKERSINKKKAAIIMLFGALGSLFLSILQSYYRDNQPQGRYFISIVLLFGFFIANSIDTRDKILATSKGLIIYTVCTIIHFMVIAAWIWMFSYAWIYYMKQMII